MENLQITVVSGVKLVVFCCGLFAYYFSLKNSFNLLNERQKVSKVRLDCNDTEIREIRKDLTILKTQHESKHCESKRKRK